MSMALAYNQSDLYQRFMERVAHTAPPLLRALEYFNYDACENDVRAIESFISQHLPAVETLATIALSLAKDEGPVDNDLIEWLFNLSRTIDSKILANPLLESIGQEKTASLESAAADLAYATSIIDLNNCKEIKEVLADKGYLKNA